MKSSTNSTALHMLSNSILHACTNTCYQKLFGCGTQYAHSHGVFCTLQAGKQSNNTTRCEMQALSPSQHTAPLQHHTHLQELSMVRLPNTVRKKWAGKKASATNCACTVHPQLILNALKHTCKATPLILATTSNSCACGCSCLWHQLQKVLRG